MAQAHKQRVLQIVHESFADLSLDEKIKPVHSCLMANITKTDRQNIGGHFHPSVVSPHVEWLVAPGLTPYPEALAFMEARADAIRQGTAGELVWLVEHPSLYTAGTSTNPDDLKDASRFPVYDAGRGGQYTYHGPGQRVAYVMLDLKRRREDVRAFVAALESWIVTALDRFNIKGEVREDRVGVWVSRPDRPPIAPNLPAEDKIAAIGIRLRRWVSFHGISLNVEPDLSHFTGIVPCGIEGYGITSLVDLGLPVTMEDADEALFFAFNEVFGPAMKL
jgi:lipoyl(octanoyl) transferase